MLNDKQNSNNFIDDNETEQDLLTALGEMTEEEILEISKKYD